MLYLRWLMLHLLDNHNCILEYTGPVAEKKMRRMAYQIIENNADENFLILAGIRESGSVVARYSKDAGGNITCSNRDDQYYAR